MIIKEERADNVLYLIMSDIGSSHRAMFLPNQDAADFVRTGDDFVIAMSDGVGSCKNAGEGAKLAVSSAIVAFGLVGNGMLAFDCPALIGKVLETWRSSLNGSSQDDSCATLKAVYKIGHTIKMISLGDGLLIVSSDGFNIIAPVEDYAFSNETKCLCSRVMAEDFWTAEFHVDMFKPFTVFLCTDGVSNTIQAGKELEMITEIEKGINVRNLKEELTDFMKDISNYSFDDITLGVVKHE